MHSWNPGGKGRWKECQPDEFSCDLRFRPFGMLSPDPLPCQFSGKQAHLKRYEEAFLPWH
jgi:hypothetical protein